MDDQVKTFSAAAVAALGNATTAMESPKPLTVALPNLNNLPDRLDDQTLRELRAFASSRLPELPPSSEKHFVQCLRVLIATLPKKVTDDLGGELVVSTYRRMLGHYPDDAISYMTEQALYLKWFPTIAECIELIKGWRRDDDETRNRIEASRLIHAERRKREAEVPCEPKAPPITQREVDAMPEEMQRLGISCGALQVDENGKVTPVNPVGT
jgi:hypothetical protein